MGSPDTHDCKIDNAARLCAAASGAVAVLEASRETLARRVENLVKCKNEFQELARCL